MATFRDATKKHQDVSRKEAGYAYRVTIWVWNGEGGIIEIYFHREPYAHKVENLCKRLGSEVVDFEIVQL